MNETFELTAIPSKKFTSESQFKEFFFKRPAVNTAIRSKVLALKPNREVLTLSSSKNITPAQIRSRLPWKEAINRGLGIVSRQRKTGNKTVIDVGLVKRSGAAAARRRKNTLPLANFLDL
ncbi:MAG: hypothetical protein RI909_581 [Bacteroidota bacterium]|jgi:hypothetical protein